MKKIVLLIIILIPFLTPRVVNAETISLGVYPPILQINATAPASVQNPITIENTQDQTISLEIGFKEFLPSPSENGEIEYVDSPLPPIFQKMQIYDGDHVVNQVTLAPKQKKTLNLHIGIQADEKSSDYYFSVLFISKADNLVGSSQSQAQIGIATNVLLSIGQNGGIEGKISEFSSPFFLSRGPVPFKVKVENESSHYITTQGIILIRNIFGQTIGKVDLLPVNVLANSTRIIPAPNEADISNPKASWGEKFLLGIYTAKVTIGLSPEGPIISKTTTFIAFPLELLAGFVLSLIIVLIIIKKVREKQRELG